MNQPQDRTWLFTANDLEKVTLAIGHDLLIDQLIVRMEQAITDFSASQTAIPVRTGFNYKSPYEGLVEFMPIYDKPDEVALKVVGYHPKNPGTFNLPSILSNITTYDTRTGHLKTVMDGVLPTALRTGVASALASKAMAKPQSETLGLIGCGAQSVVQLHAISRLFPLTKVLYYDIDKAAEQSFMDRIAFLELEAEFVPTPIDKQLEESDIICTATSIEVGKGPLFQQYICKDHLHFNAVGSDFPGKIELPRTLLQNSFVVPDFLEQAKKEGECQQLEDAEIGPELVDFMNTPEKWGAIQKQLSVFDSTGWPLEDLVVARLFCELATELGYGTQIPLENTKGDVRNPYDFISKKVKA